MVTSVRPDTRTKHVLILASSIAQKSALTLHIRHHLVPSSLSPQSCSTLVPPPVGAEENPLQYSYSIWFTQRQRGSVSTTSNYEDTIKLIGSFSSVKHHAHLWSVSSPSATTVSNIL